MNASRLGSKFGGGFWEIMGRRETWEKETEKGSGWCKVLSLEGGCIGWLRGLGEWVVALTERVGENDDD